MAWKGRLGRGEHSCLLGFKDWEPPVREGRGLDTRSFLPRLI